MKSIHQNISLPDLRRRIQQRSSIDDAMPGARLLPPAKYMLFRLYFVDGYSINQIAAVCNVWTGTISRRLKRINRELIGEYSNKSSWHKEGSETRCEKSMLTQSL